MQRFENDRKWGTPASLYGYVQRYFAWLDGRAQNAIRHLSLRRRPVRPRPHPGRTVAEDRRHAVLRPAEGCPATPWAGRSTTRRSIPAMLGNIYEQFLGYVIEIKERRLDPKAGRDTPPTRKGRFYTPAVR